MHCENRFCVYCAEDECRLDEIELDIQGSCKCCVYIEMTEAELQKKRDKVIFRDVKKF